MPDCRLPAAHRRPSELDWCFPTRGGGMPVYGAPRVTESPASLHRQSAPVSRRQSRFFSFGNGTLGCPGCTAQSLDEWVKKAEIDSGVRNGVPAEIAERLKALERENRELRHANGFGDLSHFNRAFRLRYGETPSDVGAGSRRSVR